MNEKRHSRSAAYTFGSLFRSWQPQGKGALAQLGSPAQWLALLGIVVIIVILAGRVPPTRAPGNDQSRNKPLSFGETVGDVKEREWGNVPGTRDMIWVDRERVIIPGHGEYIIDYTDFGGVFKRQPDGTWRRVGG